MWAKDKGEIILKFLNVNISQADLKGQIYVKFKNNVTRASHSIRGKKYREWRAVNILFSII